MTTKTATSHLLKLIRRVVEDQRVKQMTDLELLSRFKHNVMKRRFTA